MLEGADNKVEIIVCDSHSDDDSALIVKRYIQRHANIVKLVQAPQRGVSLARNLGAQEAKGEYLVFLDADARITLAKNEKKGERRILAQCCQVIGTVPRIIPAEMASPFHFLKRPLEQVDFLQVMKENGKTPPPTAWMINDAAFYSSKHLTRLIYSMPTLSFMKRSEIMPPRFMRYPMPA